MTVKQRSSLQRISPQQVVSAFYDSIRPFSCMTWNSQTKKVDNLLEAWRERNPRWAAEWAMNLLVEGLMEQCNVQRKLVLKRFQQADLLAQNSKSKPLFDDGLSDLTATDVATRNTVRNTPELSASNHTTRSRRSSVSLSEKLSDAPSPAYTKATLSRAQFESVKQVASDARQFPKRHPKLLKHWKIECNLIYAEAMLVRAVYQCLMNSYFKGGINLRVAWGCFNKLHSKMKKMGSQMAPDHIAGIKAGVGTFYLFLALVPGQLMRLLTLIGFVQKREKGEEYLTDVVQSNSIRSPVASLVLSTYYLFLPTGLGDVTVTLAKAKMVLDEMNQLHPTNTYFHGYANFYHRKLGNTELAVESIQKATEFAHASGCRPTLLLYLLGDTYMMNLCFEQARDTYEELLLKLKSNTETFAYMGEMTLSLAACYTALGEDDRAFELVQSIPHVYNKHSRQDAESPKIAARVLADRRMLPLLPAMMLYANRDLAHLNQPDADRLHRFNTKLLKGQDTSPVEVRGMRRLMDAVLNKACGRIPKARRMFESLLADQSHFNKNSAVVPSVYYELGELEWREGNLQYGRTLLLAGAKIKGEGNPTLANRYKIAKKQMKVKV